MRYFYACFLSKNFLFFFFLIFQIYASSLNELLLIYDRQSSLIASTCD